MRLCIGAKAIGAGDYRSLLCTRDGQRFSNLTAIQQPRFHPDPSTAYREAVLAVEAAAIPVAVPHETGAKLGHVLGQLDRQGNLYRIGINGRSGVSAPASAVVAMIRLLWEGHTDRHEGVTAAIPITPEATQMASMLAVTLVQWFTTGVIQSK